jgi:hypothetical protein
MNHDTGHREHFFWGERPLGKGFKIAGRVVLGIAAAAVFALVFGYLVMILWNWLMPAIFRLPQIGYWQGFGILILSKLIFGSIGGHGNGRRPGNGRSSRKHDFDWKHCKDFWRDEGSQAFERCMEEQQKPKSDSDR